MSQPDIVTPVATVDTSQCMITSPWFVQKTEYPPSLATYKPLVNGEEAFAAVHHAIANAQKTVDIICWGFQPSMYFIRNGQEPCIGELLTNIARKKNVKVRILGWEAPFNTAGIADEANLPGKGIMKIKDRAGQSATEEQYAFDRRWFSQHSYSDDLLETSGISAAAIKTVNKLSINPLFVGRGFNETERAEIAWRAKYMALDKGLSASTIGIMAATPSHHQKTVLVDYELPEHAVGFVMGHNMLDEYWDTDAHSSRDRAGGPAPWGPNEGARGFLPRQDISSQVTGPVLEHLHQNFANAWKRETGEDLLVLRNAKEGAKQLKPRPDFGTSLMAQLVRTQAQEGKRDIEKLYLQAVNNATQFIYIENQYFRWPPLAETIKNAALAQTKAGRDPGKHGALHLFVVTNVTDGGIGAGTVNTQRMLESLGRADTIPEVTKLRQIEQLRKETLSHPESTIDPGTYMDPEKNRRRTQEMREKNAEYQQKEQEIKDSVIVPESRPGLKTHICSLVAQDSPPANWVPVYVHSKLMIINDVFTTHGSANINTRSMQVDSEMNIAHECSSVTRDLRRRLWNLHTNGKGFQDEPEKAFEVWDYLIGRNDKLKNTGENIPEAPLVKFNYDKPTLKDLD
ncbi:phosphatidylserine/phosphatidylglycerophosphate/cardiolipin synthase family protein [Cronobacter turicensis]